MSAINCNGCTSCCKRDMVILGPTDNRAAFKWHNEWRNGIRFDVLDRKNNGDCVYLEQAGCGIHGHAPAICRRMDCRELYRGTTPEQRERRVRQNPQMIHIYTAGAERMHTLVLPGSKPPP